MTDWTGTGRLTAELYRSMAEQQLRGASALYEALCLAVADDARVCGLLEQLPAARRQPNLLLGAIRFCGGPINEPEAFLEFVRVRWDDVAGVMLSHRTQTNEPARCATLLPLLASLVQPLALIEVGASAGLCLVPDRYSYDYDTDAGRVRVGDSPVVLPCRVTGPAPLPGRLPEIRWRRGLDLNPLDPASDNDRRWLESLVWPEHTDRAERLRQALNLVASDPPPIVAGDLLDALPGLVQQAPTAVTVVVFHSAVLAYLSPQQRNQHARLMRQLRSERDVQWISNEAPGIVAGTELEVRSPARFVLALNERPVALAGPHGHTLDWLG